MLRIVRAWRVEEIVALYEAAGWWRDSVEARRAIGPMIAGSFRFMVGTEGERAVAMGRVISDGASDAYIQDVVVLPAWRGRGIGREIIRALTEECVEQGIVWIGLVAEPGTTPFYERLGFRAIPGFVAMRFPTREQP
jgi:GNAT superfamily N-acetyltransferase